MPKVTIYEEIEAFLSREVPHGDQREPLGMLAEARGLLIRIATVLPTEAVSAEGCIRCVAIEEWLRSDTQGEYAGMCAICTNCGREINLREVDCYEPGHYAKPAPGTTT
jgi:hypothetical protein